MLIDAIFGFLMATCGLLAGWWLRGRIGAVAAGDESEEQRRTHEAMTQLHDLAMRIATHVGEHSSRVEEINQELASSNAGETATVVAAVAKLLAANQQMERQLENAEEKLQEQARLVKTHAAEARTDALTGLANRRAFDDELARRHAEFERQGKPYTVVLGDIDHFKRFNDAHGHQVGDEVLRRVAKVLRGAAREMDMVARYGGEEFVVILPGTTVADAQTTLARLRKAVETDRLRHNGQELNVTVSLGAAEQLPGEDAAVLVRRADAAMYAAKEAGRNRACWHDGRAIHPVGGDERARRRTARGAMSRRRSPPAPAAAPRTGERRKGMADRSEFSIVLGRRLAEWRRGGEPPAVVLVRIDDYPGIVVRHGRQAGLMVLRATAQFLAAAVREMDMVAEYDETTFALLLPGADMGSVVRICERVREAIARCELPAPTGRVTFTVSVSGVVTQKSDETQMLLWRVEEALDSAIKAGGNSCFFHNGQTCETLAATLRALSESVA